MPDIKDLAARINGEISAHREKVCRHRSHQAKQHKDRQQRHERLQTGFDQIRDVCTPRFESLIAQLKDEQSEFDKTAR